MNREILAIVPHAPGAESAVAERLPEGTMVQSSGDWTVVLSTGRRHSAFGRALRRQRIKDAPQRLRQLEALMPLGPVLPAVPGHIVSVDDIPGLLAANSDLLARLSARAFGKVQYQIAVEWPPADVLEKFRDTPEIAPLFAAPVVTSEAMTRAVTRLADRLGATVIAEVEPYADEIAELPITETMVCNVVLLVDAAQVSALDTSVEAVDAIWPEGFLIKQVGPGPATSFCAFRVLRHGPKSLARARRVLDLPAVCAIDEVARARQAALRRGDLAASDIRTAAQLLEARARMLGEGDHVYLLEAQSEAARPRAQQAAIA